MRSFKKKTPNCSLQLHALVLPLSTPGRRHSGDNPLSPCPTSPKFQVDGLIVGPLLGHSKQSNFQPLRLSLVCRSVIAKSPKPRLTDLDVLMSWWDIPKQRCPITWMFDFNSEASSDYRCNFWIALDGAQLVIYDHGWISCNTVDMSFKPLTKYRYSNKASSFKGILCSANPTGHRAAVKNSDVPKPPSGKAARKPLTRTGSADSTMLFIRKRLSTRRCAIENGSYNEFKTYDIVIW